MISASGGRELSPEVADSMHELRNEVSVRRPGRSVPMTAGGASDAYDNENTVYLLVRDAVYDVAACARLRPTTTDYTLADLFGNLLRSYPQPRDPPPWGPGRFTTEVRRTDCGRVLALSESSLKWLGAAMGFARQQHVKGLVLATSIGVERLLIRAGFNLHRLTAPCRAREGLIVTLFIAVPPDAAPGALDGEHGTFMQRVEACSLQYQIVQRIPAMASGEQNA